MTKHILKVHLAILLFSLAGVIGSYVSIDAIYVTLARVLFSSLFLYVLININHESLKTNLKDFILFVISGSILAFHWFSFLKTIQLSNVAIGTITFSTFPLFLIFLEPLIYHISFSKEKLLIALTMIFGVYLTCSGVETQSLLAIILGLLSALSYAILSLFQKYFINKYSSRVICFFQQSVATIILLPSLFSFSGTITLFEIVCLLFLGIVCTALGHSLYVSSLKYVDVKSASIISSMETVYGIILAFLLLHQIPSLKVLCGGIIILLMSVYLSLKEK